MGNEAKVRYLKAVKKNLRCSEKHRRTFLAELERSLNDYLAESPEADEATLCAAFGTPETVAADYLSTLDAKEIKKAFGWKKIILIGVIIALLIWGVGVTIAVIDAHKKGNGYGKTYLIDEKTNTSILIAEEFY